jgi:hypothetical protein
MPDLKRLVAGATVAAMLAGAGLALRVARAQDGLPDLTGTWTGATKGKEASLDPLVKGGTVKSSFAAAFAQTGPDLAITLTNAGDPPVDLAGSVGNGTFWAVSGDPSTPLFIVGHADRKAGHLKGGVFAGGPGRAVDAKFMAAKSTVALSTGSPLLPLRIAAVPAAAPAQAPSIAGAWTGTMSGKFSSLETGGKPVRGRIPVSLTATVAGDDATLALTLHHDTGDEVIPLSGKSGNGAFWAYNGDASDPVMFVGSIGGKAPRLKLKARGVHAGPAELSEVTLSLKKSLVALQGTAAAGAAIADATVTLKDRNGTSVSAVTGSGGAFALDTAGLTPPFLLKVDLPLGGSLYGVATAAGVANLHPLTDLILRTWYGVKGTDLATAFATLDSSTPMPTALEIELLEGLVRRAIQKWLVDRGIDPATFDLIRSSFAADGTGFDAILDGTTVAPDGGSLTITDGTTTQESSFSLSSVSGTVTVDTTVTSPAGTSTSQDGTALPGDAAMQDAVAGALATVESLRSKANARGAALTATDLAAFATADYLDGGMSRAWWSADMATGLRGATMGPVGLRSVVAFDADAGIVVLDLLFPVTAGSAHEDAKARMSFRKTGSAWLLYGDRRITDLQVGVEFRTDYFPWGVDGPRRHVQVDVDPPVGTVQSVTITGGGIFNATDVPKGPSTKISTVKPTPSTELDLEFDMFYTGLDVPDFPAPGTEFQVTVTPVSGPAQVYTVVSGGTTTESIAILAPTGYSLATDAHPGTPFTAQWTRPTTFAVERLEFSGTGYSANFSKDVRSAGVVSPTATEGTVTIPTTAGGETVTSADFYLSFTGPNGELIVVIYSFQ